MDGDGVNDGEVEDGKYTSRVDFEDDFDDFVSNTINNINRLRNRVDEYYEVVSKAEEYSKSGRENEAYEIISGFLKSTNVSAIHHESFGWIIYRYLRANLANMTSDALQTYR